jgi:hypothetical protein
MKDITTDIFNRLEIQREAFYELYGSFSQRQLTLKPGPDSWNLVQVMRHLITAEKLSLIYIKRKISGHSGHLQGAGVGSTLRFLILKLAFMLPFKYQAPKIAQVHEENPDFNSMCNEWDIVRKEYFELIETCDRATLAKAVYRHPRAGLLNMKQALEFMEIHVAHHLKQIERIQNHPDFPDR